MSSIIKGLQVKKHISRYVTFSTWNFIEQFIIQTAIILVKSMFMFLHYN